MRRAGSPFLGGILAVLLAAGPAVSATPARDDEPARFRTEILERHPHDERAFTQGLLWDGGTLLESTGLYGASSVRRVEPTTGRVLLREDLDPGLFGEGLALLDDRLIQLTWQTGVALVRDPETLEVVGSLTYPGEGWGLAPLGDALVMTDGSDRLFLRDPDDFRLLREVPVTMKGRSLARLNELEVVEGVVYANVLDADEVVRIDPETGRVTARISAAALRDDWDPARRGGPLNGLAWDGESWWMTGKYWPWIYRVRLVPAESPAP